MQDQNNAFDARHMATLLVIPISIIVSLVLPAFMTYEFLMGQQWILATAWCMLAAIGSATETERHLACSGILEIPEKISDAWWELGHLTGR